MIREEIERTGADPGDVVLELSEPQLAAAEEGQAQFVHAVSELGCPIALDGFIQGGQNGFLLKRYPLSYVKLGPNFIQDLATNRGTRRAITNAVLKAHRAGQRVIAQGVESLITLEMLEQLGIDEAQGYALGPPESLDSLLGATA